MDLATELGIVVREESLSVYDIYTADECFLTGTAAEVIPAVILDERNIGTGKPGPITNRVIDAFRAHVKVSGLVIN
jgi:branched-chain amino acid aminotransferase